MITLKISPEVSNNGIKYFVLGININTKSFNSLEDAEKYAYECSDTIIMNTDYETVDIQWQDVAMKVVKHTRYYGSKEVQLKRMKPRYEKFSYMVGYKSHVGTREQITVVSTGTEVWVELRDTQYVSGVKRFNDGLQSTKELATIILDLQEYWLNCASPEAPDFKTGRYQTWVQAQPICIVGCNNDGKAWRRVDAFRVCDMLTRYPKFHEFLKSLVGENKVEVKSS